MNTPTLLVSSDRGVTWTEVRDPFEEQPAAGVWIRFGGDGTLDAIYGCICQGVLDTAEIGRRVGLPQWCIKDLLIEPDSSDGDYQKIAKEYESARRVGAFLRTIPMVLDLGAENDLADSGRSPL